MSTVDAMLSLHHNSGFKVGAIVELQDARACTCSRHEQLRVALYMSVIVPEGSVVQRCIKKR